MSVSSAACVFHNILQVLRVFFTMLYKDCQCVFYNEYLSIVTHNKLKYNKFFVFLVNYSRTFVIVKNIQLMSPKYLYFEFSYTYLLMTLLYNIKYIQHSVDVNQENFLFPRTIWVL